jgi:hypothetical protein
MTNKSGLAVGLVAALCMVALLAGCGSGSSGMPSTKVPATDSQGVPNYANSANWLSLPAKATKNVDVFFLYPTIYQQSNSSDPIVCAVDDSQMLSGAKAAFSRTATVFSPLANIYAPYYRQAAIQVLTKPLDEQQQIVGGQPTSDALSAFDYYIKHLNQGRPFILAGHSQGSNIMINLLAAYMKKNPEVYKRMIAAYVPGYSITPEYLAQNPELKFATGADDTQVIVSFNTVSPTLKTPDPVVLPGAMVINPITWTRDETVAKADQNLGGIALDSNGKAVLDAQGQPKRVLGYADAHIDSAKGELICSTADTGTLDPGNAMVGAGIFHNYDYPFYFFDIRANTENRVAHYLNGGYSLVTEPQAGYQPIYDFISGAKKTVDMTMYQLADPAAQTALEAAAKRGVKVRVLLNADPEGGGGTKLNQAAYDDLHANHVSVRWAWSGTLWHQKSIIRDGDAAVVMTCNLYAPYYAILRDYAVITHNTATASGMEATFNNDWNDTNSPPTEGVVPVGSELVWSPGAEPGLVNLIDSARPGTTLYAEDEQLDSQPIEQALIAAVRRGVTVDLTMTYSSSYVSGFNTLTAGGVHVSLYQPNAAIYIHSKAISVNNDTVYVGSCNFTAEMTDQNRNAGIITTDPEVVHGITSTMTSDFAGATPYTASH